MTPRPAALPGDLNTAPLALAPVDAWGDGLLVVVDQPPTVKQQRGTTMMTLTTYGFNDAALADLHARWQGWWDARFETVAPGCD